MYNLPHITSSPVSTILYCISLSILTPQGEEMHLNRKNGCRSSLAMQLCLYITGQDLRESAHCSLYQCDVHFGFSKDNILYAWWPKQKKKKTANELHGARNFPNQVLWELMCARLILCVCAGVCMCVCYSSHCSTQPEGSVFDPWL